MKIFGLLGDDFLFLCAFFNDWKKRTQNHEVMCLPFKGLYRSYLYFGIGGSREGISLKRDKRHLYFKTLRISLRCKLEYGILLIGNYLYNGQKQPILSGF